MDLNTLVTRLRTGGALPRLGRRPLAQFGTQNRPYRGALILPERLVQENAFRDEDVRYRTVIANDGTRYSPTQLKQGVLTGSVLVELGDSDIASELTSRDYDALLNLLANNASMDAEANIINFLDITINRALIEKNEKYRWDGLVKRLVERRGDNGFREDVPVVTPPGHMLYAADPWSDATVDPFDQIAAACQILINKGYRPTAAITRSQVTSIIASNPNTKIRTGRVTLTSGGALAGVGGRATLDDVNGQLQADNLPSLETYDRRYHTQTGSLPFIEDGAMVIIGETERTEEIALDNNEIELIEGTLGYLAVGRAAGQPQPGRVIRATHKEDKPPRIEAEGWQTSGPVFQDPEAWVTIRNIHTGTP
jgi:hypothetical protein